MPWLWCLCCASKRKLAGLAWDCTSVRSQEVSSTGPLLAEQEGDYAKDPAKPRWLRVGVGVMSSFLGPEQEKYTTDTRATRS